MYNHVVRSAATYGHPTGSQTDSIVPRPGGHMVEWGQSKLDACAGRGHSPVVCNVDILHVLRAVNVTDKLVIIHTGDM